MNRSYRMRENYTFAGVSELGEWKIYISEVSKVEFIIE